MLYVTMITLVFKLITGLRARNGLLSRNKSGVGTGVWYADTGLMGLFWRLWGAAEQYCSFPQLVDMYEFKDGRPFNWDGDFPGYNAMI